MKYYLVTHTERSSEYEFTTKSLAAIPIDINLDDWAKMFAKDQRGSNDDDWDEKDEAYWFGAMYGYSFIPDLKEITEADYNVLAKYL